MTGARTVVGAAVVVIALLAVHVVTGGAGAQGCTPASDPVPTGFSFTTTSTDGCFSGSQTQFFVPDDQGNLAVSTTYTNQSPANTIHVLVAIGYPRTEPDCTFAFSGGDSGAIPVVDDAIHTTASLAPAQSFTIECAATFTPSTDAAAQPAVFARGDWRAAADDTRVDPAPAGMFQTSTVSGSGLCGTSIITMWAVQGLPLVGTAFDDVMAGASNGAVVDRFNVDDNIVAGDGDDLVCSWEGDDRVEGGPGDDRLFVGAGNDQAIGEAGDDTLAGGPGNDILRGNTDADILDGGEGDDRLLGGTGADQMVGGEGEDFLGGFGGDDLINGGPGNDTIFGGFGADRITGDDGNDVIRGLIGDDILDGGPGNDVLDGDRGNDSIVGGPGNDVIRGGNASDILSGGDGDDSVSGGRADDSLSGGLGEDVCVGNLHVVADVTDGTCETVFGIP